MQCFYLAHHELQNANSMIAVLVLGSITLINFTIIVPPSGHNLPACSVCLQVCISRRLQLVHA